MLELPRFEERDLLYESTEAFSSGGQGLLYSVTARTQLSDEVLAKKQYLLKKLRKHQSSSELTRYFNNLDSIHRELIKPKSYFHSRLALPLGIVESDGRPVGYLMRKFESGCYATLSKSRGDIPTLQQFSIFLNSKDEQDQFRTPQLGRMEVCFAIADFLSTLAMLHDRNIILGDISSANLVLQNVEKQPNVYRTIFLDVDAFCVSGRQPREYVEDSFQYEVPERRLGGQIPNFQTDVYKAALIVIRLMSQLDDSGSHSYSLRDLDRCEDLLKEFGGNTMVELFRRACSADPSLRPTASLLANVWKAELKYLGH